MSYSDDVAAHAQITGGVRGPPAADGEPTPRPSSQFWKQLRDRGAASSVLAAGAVMTGLWAAIQARPDLWRPVLNMLSDKNDLTPAAREKQLRKIAAEAKAGDYKLDINVGSFLQSVGEVPGAPGFLRDAPDWLNAQVGTTALIEGLATLSDGLQGLVGVDVLDEALKLTQSNAEVAVTEFAASAVGFLRGDTAWDPDVAALGDGQGEDQYRDQDDAPPDTVELGDGDGDGDEDVFDALDREDRLGGSTETAAAADAPSRWSLFGNSFPAFGAEGSLFGNSFPTFGSTWDAEREADLALLRANPGPQFDREAFEAAEGQPLAIGPAEPKQTFAGFGATQEQAIREMAANVNAGAPMVQAGTGYFRRPERARMCDRVGAEMSRLQVGGGKGKPKYAGSLQGYYDGLSDAKKQYLANLFYKTFKASGGQRFLYEQMLIDPARPKGDDAPSWREVRAWHAAQTGNQLSRPVKAKATTLAAIITPAMLVPLRRIGCDSVVMQGPTDSADRAKSMADGAYKGLVNFVDYATKRSFPYPVKVVGSAKECGARFQDMIKLVEREYGAAAFKKTIERVLLVHDNGSEFGEAWKDLVRAALPDAEVTFQAGQAGNPNSNPVVENSNKQIRNVLRRIAQANRETITDGPGAPEVGTADDGRKKPWQSYWYGAQGATFKQMVKLVNERIDHSLGRTELQDTYEAGRSSSTAKKDSKRQGGLTPARVWAAYRDVAKGGASAEAARVVQDSQRALIEDAGKRRGPASLSPDDYFQKGDVVRRENAQYRKDGVRSNMSKQGNRFSKSTYVVHKRFVPGGSGPPSYELALRSGARPADFKTRDANGTQVSTVKYGHYQLIRIIGEATVPKGAMVGTRAAAGAPQAPQAQDRIRVREVRDAGSNTWALADTDDGDERWSEGAVLSARSGRSGTVVTVRLDAEARAGGRAATTVAFNISNRRAATYLPADKWELI